MTRWQDGFRDALAHYVIRNGAPVKPGDEQSRYYGWQAPDAEALYTHLACCGISYDDITYQDTTWTEFQGTFREGTDRVAGIVVTITCNCGRISGREWRYERGYAELIRAITTGKETG